MTLSTPVCSKAASNMRKIAAPLFAGTEINFFSYARDFERNKSISLQTDNSLFHAWFEANNPYCSAVTPEGVYTFDQVQNADLQQSARTLQYGNGIQIFKRHNAFTEIFTFASPNETNTVLQFYSNHREIINKFIYYFKDKAAHLIERAMQDPFIVPENMLAISNNQAVPSIDTESLKNVFDTRHYYFDDNVAIKLSKRELQCLNLYLKGLSTSQIATLMSVKKVTADTFMRNVKHKFNCSSKPELFEKLWNYKVLNTNGLFD